MSDQKKINKIDEKEIIIGFIATASAGLSSKEEVLEKYQTVENKIDDINLQLADLQSDSERWNMIIDLQNCDEIQKLAEEYGTQENILIRYKELEKERNQWAGFLNSLESILNNYKNFNKAICFSNIRELLRHKPDVKIGQIEKEAGIRVGYMSRLEKEGNTSEPSVEFIVSAAKLLNISVDTLISIDLIGLTPTEQYLVKFFDKLKSDTLQDKLEWVSESSFNLNGMETDINGWCYHPLFSEETFFEETECEYPKEITRVVFNSKTFGPHTYISGDCFSIRLKNGTTLYLMDIEKSVHKTTDTTAFAKEAGMYVPSKGNSLLVASQDNTPVAPLLEELFSVVKERMEHPKVNDDVKYAIDSFMNDDLMDDPINIDDIPF